MRTCFCSKIQLLQKCFGEGDLIWQLRLFLFISNHQQRSFSGAELHVFDLADLALAVEHRATDQVAQVCPARL